MKWKTVVVNHDFEIRVDLDRFDAAMGDLNEEADYLDLLAKEAGGLTRSEILRAVAKILRDAKKKFLVGEGKEEERQRAVAVYYHTGEEVEI